MCGIVVEVILILPTLVYAVQPREKRLDGKNVQEASCEKEQVLLYKRICIDKNYDTENLPSNQDAIPIYYVVKEMDILEINEKGKTIEIEMGLVRGWQDERIDLYDEDLVEFHKIPSQLWFPSDKKRHARSMEQDIELLLIGQHDSSGAWVMTYSEIYLNLHCDFKFAKFPMDTQHCQFMLTNENSDYLQLLPLANESSGQLRALLSLDEEKEALAFLELDGFEITTLFVHGNDLGDKALSYWGFNLTMRRITSTCVFQYYVPGAAIVCVSHISFIIPHYSIPGRIGLLATLFLTLMNIFINHMVSIIKKIDQLSHIN